MLTYLNLKKEKTISFVSDGLTGEKTEFNNELPFIKFFYRLAGFRSIMNSAHLSASEAFLVKSWIDLCRICIAILGSN